MYKINLNKERLGAFIQSDVYNKSWITDRYCLKPLKQKITIL